jgi:hypothetical protein
MGYKMRYTNCNIKIWKWLRNTAKLIELTFKTNKEEAKTPSFEQKDDFRGAQLVAGYFLKQN